MTPLSEKPIGIFDSGVGGLTVMKKIMEHLPNEDIIYFGDTARVPYGNKSPETVLRYSIENTLFLLEHNIKLLVVACNTASAYALPRLQQTFKIPILGVIEPSAKKACAVTKNHKIGVLGTRGTISSKVYQHEIKKHHPDAEVYGQACPLFVPLVEEQLYAHPITEMLVCEYLESISKHGIDTLLLGCTHYPLLIETIQKQIPQHIHVVDSATACAEAVQKELHEHKLSTASSSCGTYKFIVSDDPQKFQLLGKDFLGKDISDSTLGFFSHSE
jgi:glutamate racemase